ncbi:hypothetical protein D9M71_129170 [compost metagenome]
MVVDHGDHRMQLNIRAGQTGIGFQKTTALSDVADKGTTSVPDVIDERLAHLHAAAYRDAKQRRILAFVTEHHVRMVL